MNHRTLMSFGGLLPLALMGCGASPSSAVETMKPAFLDSSTTIKVWMDTPRLVNEVTGKFSVSIDGQPVKVSKIEVGGQPESERTLPRTEGRIILAGTIQSALGGKEWDPDGEITQMKEIRPGVHEIVLKLPKGVFQYKVTRNGSWNENYGAGFVPGGANISITIPKDGTLVRFIVDLNAKSIKNSLENPSEVAVPTEAPAPISNKPIKFPVAILTLEKPITAGQLDDAITVTGFGAKYRVYARDVLNEPAYLYEGKLGAQYSRTKTTFKVWSPVSRTAFVALKNSTGDVQKHAMKRAANGVWTAEIPGDLHLREYRFEFESYGEKRTATDINGVSANRDSTWSVVMDLTRTNPAQWPSDAKIRHKSQTDAVLYELHVRDFTALVSSGVKPENRGKYAGLVQRGTKVPGTNFSTGLDYLVNLGVTDIHLLPVQNFLLSHEGDYTWGYATNLFNVPEETYATQPGKPAEVIREFKTMVSEMHKSGLRVVLDVVYNHTWPPEGKDSAFWQTVPYFYFRTNDRGQILNESGVGNALADERIMARKFVRDSLLFWMDEYKIDGFRFDLIGMHRPESVRDWAKVMRAKRPDIVLYGEPWTGGGPTYFGKGAQRGSGVAVFNDRFRGTFRGDLDGNNRAFAAGGGADRNGLEMAIRGWLDRPGQSDGFTDSPAETVNYISAHDNLTLLDRIMKTGLNDEMQQRAIRLGGAAVLLSQGVPFLEGGAQIGRTKGGNHNSYDAGDKVNGYDWSRAQKFTATNDYYRGLIALRRAHQSFSLDTGDQVNRALKFWPAANSPASSIVFTLDGTVAGDRFKEYLVVLHGAPQSGTVALPAGAPWNVLADDARASATPIRKASGSVTLAPLGAYVFAR